jgi:hypothetical protein
MRILLFLCLLILISSCSRNPVNAIFDEAKKYDKTFAVSVPGWMIRTAVKEAVKNESLDEAIEDISAIPSALKGARVLVASALPPHILQNLMVKSAALNKRGYSEYIAVKNKDFKFNLYGFEKKDKLTDLFFYGNSRDDGLILIKLETDISTKDFENIARKVQNSVAEK